jgi:8-amino-7-oxononanoate synthase
MHLTDGTALRGAVGVAACPEAGESCVLGPPRFEDYVPSGGETDIFAKVRALADALAAGLPACAEGLGLELRGPTAHETVIAERNGETHPVVMLGSNSYLSLTTHPQVVAAAKEACDRYGYGMGAVPLYAGTTDLHRQLEESIATFYGVEDAMLIPCGYSANVGVLAALCGAGDVIINDVYNHASIFDGTRLSGAEAKIYLHRDMRHLEKVLRSLPEAQRGRLIVTDGVFSMDGDLAPLDELCELARRYGARVMVDEAHAVGIVGPTGRGTAEHFGLTGEVDVTIGTLSKAPGAVGGYCAGSRELVQYLRYYTRTFFFSTALPPPVVAGLIEVFRLLSADAAGRDRLWENVRYLRGGLDALGFDTGQTESAVIPVMVRDEEKLGRLHSDLRRRGVFANVVTFPAVRRKQCRLRMCVMNSLTRAELDYVLATMGEVGRAHGLI